MVKEFSNKVQLIIRDSKREKRSINEKEVYKVRECFFEMFENLLKHYNVGTENSDFFRDGGDCSSLNCDPSYLFHFESFLREYRSEPQIHGYMNYFCYMPLFQRLIQRIALDEDPYDLRVFKRSLKQMQQIPKFDIDTREKSISEDSIVIKAEYHFHPWFDLMVQSRDRDEKKIQEKKTKAVDQKQEFSCLKYEYKKVPSYLDIGHMTA